MSGALLGVRVSPAIRSLVDAAGPLNAAARALLILGAAAAGQDVRPLASAMHVLIDTGGLSVPTVAALRRLLETDSRGAINLAISPAITRDSTPEPATILADLLEDPLDGVGIRV